MPIQVFQLRRWFAVAAIALTMLVVGMYLYARWRVHNALKDVPNKIALEVQQTAEGFTVSKSEQGRTLFTVRASKAVQFKKGGRAELHEVSITMYGRDSSRFDQIYGSDFEYDPQSGDVIAKGEVQIDLEANPEGLRNVDQAPPKELKNPIHLKTRGLVFNQKTGNAYTKEKVEFSIPQASGSAVGAHYVAKTNVLTLDSQIHVLLDNEGPSEITAVRGTITKLPRQVVLEHPRLKRGEDMMSSDSATLFLRNDDTVERVLASGQVQSDVKGRSKMHGRAQQAELLLTGPRSTLRTAILSGDVHLESVGVQALQADAGQVVLDFSGKTRLEKVHAAEGVKLAQHSAAGPASSSANGGSQDLEIRAPIMDFFVTGDHLDHATTSGAAQIEILQPAAKQRTLVTAGKFEAKFGERSALLSVHGSPETKIVTSTPGQPDRTSTSDLLDVATRSTGGIDSIVQQGNFAYFDDTRKAWADRARYTPADQVLILTGSPRVTEGGMTTTAHVMRLNRSTGDAVMEGDVKSTYSELQPQPGGALLASSDPIHVTSRTMTAHRSPAIAIYGGNARLWQNANIVEAPSIQFDREHRSLVAQGNSQRVSTVLIQVDKDGNATPVAINSARLTYTDSERKVHLEGGVVAKGADVTITSKQADVFLLPRSSGDSSKGGSSQLDRIVAEGDVVIQQPNRRATGQKLVYAAHDDMFVLTGGPPSIFDAEHGKITGDSLTFYRRDDRVLVEGMGTSPAITTTRVAR
jgi:lipopolysaccharide export system protein LptA